MVLRQARLTQWLPSWPASRNKLQALLLALDQRLRQLPAKNRCQCHKPTYILICSNGVVVTVPWPGTQMVRSSRRPPRRVLGDIHVGQTTIVSATAERQNTPTRLGGSPTPLTVVHAGVQGYQSAHSHGDVQHQQRLVQTCINQLHRRCFPAVAGAAAVLHI